MRVGRKVSPESKETKEKLGIQDLTEPLVNQGFLESMVTMVWMEPKENQVKTEKRD